MYRVLVGLQKILSELSESDKMIFDGYDLTEDLKFYIKEFKGKYNAQINREFQEYKHLDGALEVSRKLKPRSLILRGFIFDKTGNVETAKERLIEILNTSIAVPKKLELENGKYIFVQLDGTIYDVQREIENDNKIFDMAFNFIASDPYWYKDQMDIVIPGVYNLKSSSEEKIIGELSKFEKTRTVTIEGQTFINIIENGSFEKDSDNDGLADGWTRSYLTCNISNDRITGDKCQKLIYTNGNTAFPCIYKKINHIDFSDVFFMSLYGKVINLNTKIRILIYCYDSSENYLGSLYTDYITTNYWNQKYKSFVFFENTARIVFRVELYVPEGESAESYVDKVIFTDLTKIGELPLALKVFFFNEYISWESLNTGTVIKALDGRAKTGQEWLNELITKSESLFSLGYKYDNEIIKTHVINERNNLFNIENVVIKDSTVFKTFIDKENNIIHQYKNGVSGAQSSWHFTMKFKPNITYIFRALVKNNNAVSVFIYRKGVTFEYVKAFYFAPGKSENFNEKIYEFYSEFNEDLDVFITFAAGTLYNAELEIKNLQIYEKSDNVHDREVYDQEDFSFTKELYSYSFIKDKVIVKDGKINKFKKWRRLSVSGSEDITSVVENYTTENYYCIVCQSFLNPWGVWNGEGICLGENGRILPMLPNTTINSLHWFYTNANLYIYIEKEKIDSFSGATLLLKTQSYFIAHPHTIIYQLALPEIESVEYEGELNIYSGDNYILSDAFITIEGPKKYLNG